MTTFMMMQRITLPERHLSDMPDEIIHNVFKHLDVPDLLSASRTSHHLRSIALDPLLHHRRLRASQHLLENLLPHRPNIAALQPPFASIYLSRTHLAARRLHWSLVSIRLNRSLSRRPAVTALVSANIIPRECCKRDRTSGEYIVYGFDRGGPIVEKKRKVEREKMKEGLRVWLERKAGEITRRRRAGGQGVKVMAWKFSRRTQTKDPSRGWPGGQSDMVQLEGPEGGVYGLRKFWEDVGTGERMVLGSA